MIVRGNTAFVAIVALSLLPALGACGARGEAGTGSQVVAARTALPGLVGRRCEYVSEHDEVPAFSDLARLGTRGNIELWGFHVEPSDTVVLSVRYDEEGRLAWVRAIQSSLSGEDVASLEQLMLASLNERGPADWGVRLSVVGGEYAGLEPSIVCPAEIRRNGQASVVARPTSERGYRALEGIRGRRYRVEISIDEQGRILNVRLPRTTGEGEVDQFLLDWAHATRFHPKLHDGLPLATTVVEVIHIRRRR